MKDPDWQLARIAEAHYPAPHPMTGAHGYCHECQSRWPCPTNLWASKDMDVLGHWLQGEPT